MVEELETECPPSRGLTISEAADAVATWALMGAVVALCWLGEVLARRDERRRGR